MEIVNFPSEQYNKVGASGVCPHCPVKSYFHPVTSAHKEMRKAVPTAPDQYWICNAAQCQSCKAFVLVVGSKVISGNSPYRLEACYPLDKPRDEVDETVPPPIRSDFQEALRCQWIMAFKAAVTMCRRAIQASALGIGASSKKKLIDQIDELADRGIITQPLKEMAHEVRLAGNVGAHPDEDGLKNVTEQDANDVVEFTREYLHHVYVMPAKLKARKEPPQPEAKP